MHLVSTLSRLQSRYAWSKPVPGTPSIHDALDPSGYTPVHMYMVARHGTRWPTKDRMVQMDGLLATMKASLMYCCPCPVHEQHLLLCAARWQALCQSTSGWQTSAHLLSICG
jgi:hypothetical protein